MAYTFPPKSTLSCVHEAVAVKVMVIIPHTFGVV